jgi:hypothetical protein
MTARKEQSPSATLGPEVAFRTLGVGADETALYMANWSVKYADQIATINEMVEKEGIWSDGLRLF